MIIGDPYKFAFIINIVKEWSTNNFVAGVFSVSMNGYVFPRELLNTTLNSELYMFFENKDSSLITKPVNAELFNTNKLEAYKNIYKTTFPENELIDNNYLYNCKFREMEDNGYHIFSVSDGRNIKILFSDVENIEDNILEEDIEELIISISELDSIIKKLKEYYSNYIAI